MAGEDGGYDRGSRKVLNEVPEPDGAGVMTIALTLATVLSTLRRCRRFDLHQQSTALRNDLHATRPPSIRYQFNVAVAARA